MTDFVFKAHSSWRYAVLVFAVITVVYALVGLARKTPVDNRGLRMMKMFMIFIDIQFVLGLVLLFLRPFYSSLIGHIVMMIAAAAVAHLGLVRLKKAAPEARSYGLMLASALIPLALMIGGILSIQRPVL